MEDLLQYVWKHKIFPLKKLTTTNGEDLDIIDVGLQNPNSGPDFFNAKIKINGITWVGNVEIHTKASDWYKHGHQKDKVYDSVILHVCTDIDTIVYNTDNEVIPQLQLSVPDYVWTNYKELLKADKLPSCHAILKDIPKFTIHSFMSSLQAERMEQRTELIYNRLNLYKGDWEKTFFVTLVRNFGFGINGDAFEAWANRLPMNIIAKHRDSLFQLEAIFFGQAGMLSDECPYSSHNMTKEINDSYYCELKREFNYLSKLFSIEPIDESMWRFLRLRPYNFPHVRIAQLAYLYHKNYGLFSNVIDADNVKRVRDIFKGETSEYWQSHFMFGLENLKHTKRISDSTINLLIINTVSTFLYAYGMHRANQTLCDRALSFLDELPPEQNFITKMWKNSGIAADNAADSQALIQLKREYCEKKKCLYCRFGYEYLKHKSQ